MDLTHIYERKVDPQGQDSLARISRLVRPRSTVLELGPATGYFTRHLHDALECTVDCVEYSPEMAEMARPYAREMVVGDLDQIELPARFRHGAYDHVIAADVLEHLKNPWRVLEGARSLLKPTGSILLSIPNIAHAALIAELIAGRFEYRDEGLLDRTHLRFFTRASIVDMLRRTGFRAKSIDRIEWMPEQTEFKRVLEELPPRLRDYLLLHGDALTYQFIVNATPGEMTDTETRASAEQSQGPAEPYLIAKLYWAPDGIALSEERCILRPLPLRNEPCRIEFDLPPNAAFRNLRFDPADRPGFLHLHQIRLYEKRADGGEGADVFACNDWREITRRFSLDALAPGNSALSSTFLATSDDPKLFYSGAADHRPSPGHHYCFEVRMTWPVSADFLVAESIYSRQINEIQSRLARADARIRDYAERLDGLQKRNNNLARCRDEAAMFEPLFIQQEARTRELEKVLAEIYGSRAWKMIERWRRLKAKLLRR